MHGTIHADPAPSKIADIIRAMKSIGKASLRGTHQELGAYPAVKIGPRAT